MTKHKKFLGFVISITILSSIKPTTQIPIISYKRRNNSQDFIFAKKNIESTAHSHDISKYKIFTDVPSKNLHISRFNPVWEILTNNFSDKINIFDRQAGLQNQRTEEDNDLFDKYVFMMEMENLASIVGGTPPHEWRFN